MNCGICGHEFHASEKARIEQRANDTVFIHTYCPACKQQYYTHTHFGEWMLVTRNQPSKQEATQLKPLLDELASGRPHTDTAETMRKMGMDPNRPFTVALADGQTLEVDPVTRVARLTTAPAKHGALPFTPLPPAAED